MTETCRNGIVLPEEWPPRQNDLDSWQPMRVPWLENPPEVVSIDGGRQLLTDDFLVAQTSMTRVFHRPVKHPCNPVMFPETAEECHPDYPPCAIARFGTWFDDRDERFKMWYMAGYAGGLAYAESRDGLRWERPELDVVPGTNLCLPRDIHPDSGTVWIEKEADEARFKMLLREPGGSGTQAGLGMVSDDGMYWNKPVHTGPMGDRSSMFYNPFRNKWVQSIRSSCQRGRTRHYWEADDFSAACCWTEGEPFPWLGADNLDEGGDSLPQLYNLDAVAYESIMLGLFQIHKGPPNNIGALSGTPKLTELTIGYSRDGFHWHRPDRGAFIGAVRRPGSWEQGYLEASGGVCLIMGDELWFYYNAYGGDSARIEVKGLKNGMYANGSVGLAKLRRDGFASLQSRFPGSELKTRSLVFKGSRLFVNANTVGAALRVEITEKDGSPIAGCGLDDCLPFTGNNTKAEIRWKNPEALRGLKDRPVRFRFVMDRGDLFSFWITDSPNGASGGYVAAGGPGCRGSRDE